MPRNQRLASDDLDIASYGMGSTYADSSIAPTVEVGLGGELFINAESPSPPRRKTFGRNRSSSGNRVSFSQATKTTSAKNGAVVMNNQTTQRKSQKRYNPSLPEPIAETSRGQCWRVFTRMVTCCIPNFLLVCRSDPQAKQAWREKITIFGIFLSLNLAFLFIFGGIPLYFCRIKDNFLAGQDWYDESIDSICYGVEIATYIMIFFVLAMLSLQCICSLILGIQSFLFRIAEDRPFCVTDFVEKVMILVPCYNEGEKELRKTIASILQTDYPDKVMVVVADGIVTGRGEYFNTPTVLANILGFRLDKHDEAYQYKSLGTSGENRASVYSGIYTPKQASGKAPPKSLKYVVIVKRGMPDEKDSSKPGNRGKRDSQLILMGLLNRIHHDRKRSDLDRAICQALASLEIPIREIQYLLAVDADTRISLGSISNMVYSMSTRPKVLACCGETKVDNKTKSWVTMIQVYEYFASHHLKKSFESVFGCVTCLPGCFTMYRIRDNSGRALLGSDSIYQNYSRNDITSLHEKNLYHLGEDRMLTTLLLKYFSEMSLSFVPIASCWTIVPEDFNVLLSQRRRWINSTFHNMWELMRAGTMCGFCCISMNAVVLLDMISTMILPSSIVYAAGFTYAAIADNQGLSTVTIVLYGVLFGAQVLIFLIRSRFDYIVWFLIYLILGTPIFYILLPIYSFWHMDDFSWGTTRQVRAGRRKPRPAAPAAKPEAPPPPRQSLHQDYNEKLAAMGAGQQPTGAGQQNFAWEDLEEEPSTCSSSGEGPLYSKLPPAQRSAAAGQRLSTAAVQRPPRQDPLQTDDFGFPMRSNGSYNDEHKHYPVLDGTMLDLDEEMPPIFEASREHDDENRAEI